jgi:calcineurin-like phosphoesterase family protein
MGNHDKRAQTEAVFGRVWDHYMVKTGGKLLWAFHYPTAYWPQSHYGAFHCFGHIHDNLEHEAAMDLAFPARRSMDVGVDAAKRRLGDYRPFATEEVLGFLDGRPGHGLRERGAHSDVI